MTVTQLPASLSSLRLSIFLITLAITSCGGNDFNACVYSSLEGTASCLENTSGAKSEFLKACKQILSFEKLKDQNMTMIAEQSCPGSPIATCQNALTGLADRHVYGTPSAEDIALQNRVCETAKGTFVIH